MVGRFGGALKPLRRQKESPFTLSALALVVGAAGAYGALGLKWLIEWTLKNGPGGGTAQLYKDVSPGMLVLWMAGAGLVLGLLPLVGRFGRFSGPADAIVAATQGEGKLPLLRGLVSPLAAALAVGVGASAGRYGPAVDFGATVGSFFGRIFRLPEHGVVTLLGCGAAAAIAASFNAPIAGVIFAHEAIIGSYALRGFAPTAVAAVLGSAIARSHDAEYLGLRIEGLEGIAPGIADYPIFAVVGLVSALVAMAFMQGMFVAGKLPERLGRAKWFVPAIAMALAGVIGSAVPEALGLGDETIQAVFGQLPGEPQFLPLQLWTLLGAKLVLTVLCLGLGRMPGGVFGPALFLGACVGGIAGFVAEPRLYETCAVVGAGAVISSVVGAPIATVLIVFELTGDYAATTAVMIGVVVANAFVTKFYDKSFFNRQIRTRGIDLDEGREVRVLRKRTVSELVNLEAHRLAPETALREVVNALREHQGDDHYVIDAGGQLMGVVFAESAFGPSLETTAAELAHEPRLILHADDSLIEASSKIEGLGADSVPVVASEDDPTFLGIVTEAHFVRATNEAIRAARSRERGS